MTPGARRTSLFRDFISWSRTERRRLVHRIELAESGRPETIDVGAMAGVVEPAADVLARARYRLAELDAFLARYPEAED